MYGRIFESCYSGSMIGAGPIIFAVWPYIIAHTRHTDCCVELNPELMMAVIGKCTAEEIRAAIAYFEAPDAKSRSKELDGRRLVREGEFLYRVVNFKKYKDIRDQDERREYQRNLMRRIRAAKKTAVSTSANKNSQLAMLAKEEEEVKEEVRTTTAPAGAGFPENLQTAEFKKAFTAFEQHRKETRHALKPTTREALLKKLSAWGVGKATLALHASIANGWQGVFEPGAVAFAAPRRSSAEVENAYQKRNRSAEWGKYYAEHPEAIPKEIPT